MTAAKRSFDLFCTCTGMLFLWPLFIVVALAIKLGDPGPVFFRQARIGRHGQPFRIWKFRTMVVDAEARGGPLTARADQRVTRAGSFLRRWKIDELPQLFNVLRGEMSLVGPRPEVPRYVRLYSPAEARILEFVPGITCPASIAYRNECELLAEGDDAEDRYIGSIMENKINIDLEYARRATVYSDTLIILKTLSSLFKPQRHPSSWNAGPGYERIQHLERSG